MKELSKEQLEYAVTSLKRIVEVRDYNQPQLERLSGVNQSTISKVLNRNLIPSYEMLEKLYQGVGLKITDVLNEADDPTQHLYGYLASPLTGIVRDARAERELVRVITLLKESARSFRDPDMELYWPGDHTHPVKNPEISPQQVYLIDRSRASTYDFILLFCAAPSYGVGQENEIATQAGLPAIRLVPKFISRMMSGSFLNAIDVGYTGSLDNQVNFEQEELLNAFRSIRRSYFQHRALYKNLNGNSFGSRLRKLIDDRTGDYSLFANELGVSLSYLQALMDEQFTVSNPSARLLKRMASRLCVTVGFLLGESEESDAVWIASNAALRKWVEDTPNLDAAMVFSMRDEWRHDFQLNKAALTTTSFRKTFPTMREVDWDLRYQSRMSLNGQGKNARGSRRTNGGDADATEKLF